MLALPESDQSLLVRTYFGDRSSWKKASKAAMAENSDGFRAYVRVVDDRACEGATWQDLRRAAQASGRHADVLFVVDQDSQINPFPVLVVDLSIEARVPFRSVAAELWSIENNLNISNMDWEEFADHVCSDGVFRGFA